MEQLSIHLADRMVQNQIIEDEDRVYYSYSIQLLLEKIIGISLISFISSLFGVFPEVMVFLSVFAIIRMSSDGYHCRTSLGCFAASVIVSLSTVPIASYFSHHVLYCQGGLIISMLIVLLIGTIRDPNLGLTELELHHLKKRSRIIVTVVGIIVMIMLLLSQSHYVSYMALGVIYNAISLMMVKISGKEVTEDG